MHAGHQKKGESHGDAYWEPLLWVPRTNLKPIVKTKAQAAKGHTKGFKARVPCCELSQAIGEASWDGQKQGSFFVGGWDAGMGGVPRHLMDRQGSLDMRWHPRPFWAPKKWEVDWPQGVAFHASRPSRV